MDLVLNNLIILLNSNGCNNPKDFTNALYAVSNNGKIVWRMGDVKNLLDQPDPIIDFNIINGEIYAFDFCSRKFKINVEDGSIIDYKSGRW